MGLRRRGAESRANRSSLLRHQSDRGGPARFVYRPRSPEDGSQRSVAGSGMRPFWVFWLSGWLVGTDVEVIFREGDSGPFASFLDAGRGVQPEKQIAMATRVARWDTSSRENEEFEHRLIRRRDWLETFLRLS